MYVLAHMFPECFRIFKSNERADESKYMHAEVLLGASCSMILNIYYMKQLCTEALKLLSKGKPSEFDEAESEDKLKKDQ